MSEHLADTNVGNIEYIRKQDASDWLKQYGQDVLHGKYKFSLMYIWKNIMDLPSADVVQVVRCRDCIYMGEPECLMVYDGKEWTDEDGFCHIGDRGEE